MLGSCVYFALDYFKASFIAKQKFGEEAVVLEYDLDTGNMLFTGTSCYDWQEKYDSCFLIGKKSLRNFPITAPKPSLVEFDEIGVASQVLKANLRYVACHKVSMDGWDDFELTRLEDLVQRKANQEIAPNGQRITWNYIANEFPQKTLWQCKQVGQRLLQTSPRASKHSSPDDNWTPDWYLRNSKKAQQSNARRNWKRTAAWQNSNPYKIVRSTKYPKSPPYHRSSKISAEDIAKLPDIIETRNARYVTKSISVDTKKVQKNSSNRQPSRLPERKMSKPNHPSTAEQDTSEVKGDTLFIAIPDELLLCPKGYSPTTAEINGKGHTSSEDETRTPCQQTNHQTQNNRSVTEDRVFRSIDKTNNKAKTPLSKANGVLKVPISSDDISSKVVLKSTTKSERRAEISEFNDDFQAQSVLMSPFVAAQPQLFPNVFQPINYLASLQAIALSHQNSPALLSFCTSPPKAEPVSFCHHPSGAKEMLKNLGEKGC